MIERIKELRIKIDGLAQLTRELKPKPLFRIDISLIPQGWDLEQFVKVFEQRGYAFIDSFKKEHKLKKSAIQEIPTVFKEIENTTNSLYLAKAWLGKILGELGDKTPYLNDGKRKTVDDIEGVSDRANHNDKVSNHYHLPYPEMSYIEKVDWLREEIKYIIENAEDFSENIDYIQLEQGFVYKYLCEARFYLGFELQRIKETEK
jgi:hypothetical protein